MSLKRITAPTTEPVTLAEVKTHCRVDHAADDAYLTALITKARRFVEHRQERALLTQTWEWLLDGFPPGTKYTGGLSLERPVTTFYRYPERIRLDLTPVQAIVSLNYIAPDGTLTLLDTAEYQAVGLGTNGPASVVPAWGKLWPIVRPVPESVIIRAVCGYTDVSDIPETTLHAVILLVAHWYGHREPTSDLTVNAVPFGLLDLCDVDSLVSFS